MPNLTSDDVHAADVGMVFRRADRTGRREKSVFSSRQKVCDQPEVLSPSMLLKEMRNSKLPSGTRCLSQEFFMANVSLRRADEPPESVRTD